MIPQNKDRKNQFTELRPFRGAKTAVAIEIPNTKRKQKNTVIISIMTFLRFLRGQTIGDINNII